MDIPNYLANSSRDGKEWIKRTVLKSRWGLRYYRRNGFLAEKYQMKKKYGDESQELPEIETKLRNLIEQSHQLAVQLRDM